MRLPRTKGLTMTMPDPQANSSDPQNVTPAPTTDFGATSIPAPEAPSFPQAAAPGFDEATATPGATTYGTASDPAGAHENHDELNEGPSARDDRADDCDR